jgi:hypothetical protein
MHRVELKDLWEAEWRVCALWFLMHRVELKAALDGGGVLKKSGMFLMHRVELKELLQDL